MFTENNYYNKLIKNQMKNYLKNKELIQHRTNKLLSECNTHYIFGTEKKRDQKIKQLGAENLIYIGAGAFIFRSKRTKFNNGMKINDILKQRNIKLNFYGGLYYELNNYEYCIGLTPLRTILKEMGVKHTITDDDRFIFDKNYKFESDIINYVIDLYNFNNN